MIRIPAITSDNLIVSGSAECCYPPVDKEILRGIVSKAQDGPLPQEQALRLLDAIGIVRQKTFIATSALEAKISAIDIGYPINMQSIAVHDALEPEVVENITDENTMKLEFLRLMRSSDAKGVLLSPSLAGARAYFGIRRSAKYGHLVLCGTYPSSAERPELFISCTMPVTKVEAMRAFGRVKGDFHLNEVLFVDTLRRLSALCEFAPEIERADIMPVVATTHNMVALDIAAVIKK